MRINGQRAYELLERIAYTRIGGSPEEAQAAQTLVDELASFGLEGTIETFQVDTYQVRTARLEVLEPYQKVYEVAGYGLTGSTPPEGITAELVYAEGAGPANLVDVAGKIVLVNQGLQLEKYERLAKAQVAGFISIGGQQYERDDLPVRAIREPYFKHGKIPGVSLLAPDALEMVQKGASRARLTLEQDEQKSDSRNVIAEIKGSKYPDEIIVFGAHFDSVYYSAGANDNGAGSVILMELARYFMEHPPLRTVRFCWFGSEEYGLLGSFAYVEAHADELDKIKFMINVDVAGGYLGQNTTYVMASDALKGYVEVLAKLEGLEMTLRQDVYSSDSIPFCEKGIPGINFCRFGAPIHNRHDQLQYISPDRLAELGDFTLRFSDRMVNASVFPVEKEIPDNVKKSLQRYLEARRGKSKE